jgi:mRNA interferase MazF
MMVYDKVTPYEVYWCDLPVNGEFAVGGRRPVVIVSNEKECLFSTNVLVVPMTSSIKRTDLPCNVVCNVDNRDSMALCNQITTVPKTWLREYAGRLNPKEVRGVQMALLIELGFVG